MSSFSILSKNFQIALLIQGKHNFVYTCASVFHPVDQANLNQLQRDPSTATSTWGDFGSAGGFNAAGVPNVVIPGDAWEPHSSPRAGELFSDVECLAANCEGHIADAAGDYEALVAANGGVDPIVEAANRGSLPPVRGFASRRVAFFCPWLADASYFFLKFSKFSHFPPRFFVNILLRAYAAPRSAPSSSLTGGPARGAPH